MMSSSSAFGGWTSKDMFETRMPWYPDGIAKLHNVSWSGVHQHALSISGLGGGEPNKIVHFKRVNQVEPMWNPWGIHVSSISFPTKQHLSNSKTWNLYWNDKSNKDAKQPNFLQGMFFETTPCSLANIFRIIPHFHLWIFGVRVVEMMIPSLSWAFERSAY